MWEVSRGQMRYMYAKLYHLIVFLFVAGQSELLWRQVDCSTAQRTGESLLGEPHPGHDRRTIHGR